MIIETEDLGRRFLRHDALRGVGLRVPHGAALALIGANGAGKTTLMRILVNIMRPQSGVARVLGKDSRTLSAADFNRIGYVAEGQKLPGGLTVEHYFDYLRRLYPAWDRDLEAALRAKFDLPPDRKLAKLSHGMRMKAMLAGALAFRPALLILDEPLSGLDPLTRDEVVEGLLGEAEETTIVISSHELAEIDGLATHIAYLDRGRLLFQSTTEELLARFRDVSATFQTAPASLNGVDRDWLSPKLFERTLRFIDRAYTDEAALRRSLTERFGPIAQLDVATMSLREVSKELMSASRTEIAQ
jgi:ABC-2 type transport system ATP-binding protein